MELSFDIKAKFEELLKAKRELDKFQQAYDKIVREIEKSTNSFPLMQSLQKRLTEVGNNIDVTQKKIASLSSEIGKIERSSSVYGRQFSTISSQIEQMGEIADNVFARMGNAAAQFGVMFSAQEFVNKVTQIRGAFQQIEMAFETMLGSAEKASMLMQQMVHTAATTPFDLQGVANGAKQLLAYGFAADKVNDIIIRLGDIAAGLSLPLGDIIYLYGTTMTQGRVYTRDIMQFTNRGIPMLSELAKQLGVTESKVSELVTQGKIGFPEVEKVIENLTKAGGKFGGLMEKQSQTLTGQLSNLEDNIGMMFNEIGEKSSGAIGGAIELAADMVDHYKEIGSIILGIAAAWGLNKAATAAYAAISGITAKQEIADLQAQLALLQQKEAVNGLSSDLQVNVANGKINLDQAQQIQELRNQLYSFHEEQIQAAEDVFNTANDAYEKASEAFNTSVKEVETAKSAVDAANEEVEAINEKIAASFNEGDAEGFAAAQTELATAQKKKNVAAQNLSIASKNNEIAATAKMNAATNLQTATEQKNAAVKAATTAAQNIDTASKAANSIATKALTWATVQLTTAFKGLKVAFASNPIGMALTAISIGIGLFSAFSDSTEEATEDVKRFGEQAVKTQANAQTLLEIVNSVDKNSSVYKESMEQLCGIYDDYGIKLDKEKELLTQVNASREELIKLIQKEGQARINADALKDYEKKIEDERKKIDKLVSENVDKARSYNYTGIKELEKGTSKSEEQLRSLAAKADDNLEQIKKNAEIVTRVVSSVVSSYSLQWEKANGNVQKQKQLINEMQKNASGILKNIGIDTYGVDLGIDKVANNALNKITILQKAQSSFASKVKKDQEESAARQEKNIDITKMSVEDLIKRYNAASSSVDKLNSKEAAPKVDASEADNAKEKHDKASEASDKLNSKNAKPKVDTKSIDVSRSKILLLTNELSKLSGRQWLIKILKFRI